jgi:uracil-DNA glycosylase
MTEDIIASSEFEALLDSIRRCTLCRDLPLGPRPVVQASASARLLIIGQAPGTRVHHTGIPWNDPSGDRLREWMAIDRDLFYDPSHIAIMPMGFCYPGKGKSGDLPPRAACAPAWHQALLSELPNLQLTLLIGQYAQKYYLGDRFTSVTDTVREYAPDRGNFLPLVHPSPRNRRWLSRNPWFETDVVPRLRRRVADIFKLH